MIKAITFDFWNTLYIIPSDKCLSSLRIQNLDRILRSAGWQFSPEEIRAALKYGWQKAWYQQRAFGEETTPRGHVKDILAELGIDPAASDVEEAAYQAYTRTLLDLPPVVNEGVLETLPVLAGKFKLAVICNTGATPGAILRELIKKDGLYNYFKVLVFSDEVGFAKPSTRIFKYALEHLDVANPADAAHIGDDAITDVIGAKRSGMKAVWLAPHQDWAVPEADYHVRKVNELIKLF